MNSWITFSSCLESRLLSSSPVYRRQLFLLRSLGGYCCKAHMEEGQGAASGNASAFEAAAEAVIRRISPVLDPKRYKGQAGRVRGSGYGCKFGGYELLGDVKSTFDKGLYHYSYYGRNNRTFEKYWTKSGNPKWAQVGAIETAAVASFAIYSSLDTSSFTVSFDKRWILNFEASSYMAGKIAIIGGCREYTGAPYFAAISALKIGADLSHVFCTKDAAPVIKGYSPELIVHPVLEESYSVRDEEKPSVSKKVLAEVSKWMERFDCLVVGPGLGRDPFLLDCVSDIMKLARQLNIPTVIDGDGLFLVTNNLDLVKGHSLAVLTPNINEYKRLVEKVLNCEVNEEDAPEQLLSLAKQIGGVTILRKGKYDLISNGVTVIKVSIFGSPRRCGGQGDILSGSVAVFASWARAANKQETYTKSASSPMVLGCIAGSALLRRAASLAFATKKRATLTSDIIECLGRSLEDIVPAE